MTVAGWIFFKNDGENGPKLPPGVEGAYTIPCDIFRIAGGPPGFEHTHLLIGGIATPSVDRAGEADENHYHYVAWYGNSYHQITVGAPHHEHDLNTFNGVLSPDWFLTWWKGTNADGAAILADPDCVLAVQAIPEEVDGETVFNDLDDTLWTPEERALWEARIRNVLALELPTAVTSGDKLVAFFVGALVSRANQRERWLRSN